MKNACFEVPLPSILFSGLKVERRPNRSPLNLESNDFRFEGSHFCTPLSVDAYMGVFNKGLLTYSLGGEPLDVSAGLENMQLPVTM